MVVGSGAAAVEYLVTNPVADGTLGTLPLAPALLVGAAAAAEVLLAWAAATALLLVSADDDPLLRLRMALMGCPDRNSAANPPLTHSTGQHSCPLSCIVIEVQRRVDYKSNPPPALPRNWS